MAATVINFRIMNFWNVTPCSLVDSRHIRRTCYLNCYSDVMMVGSFEMIVPIYQMSQYNIT